MSDRASVVIATVDRPLAVAELLRSLTLQTHDDFEIIVVVGPPHEGTLALLDRIGRPIKVRTCPDRNLSMARNIGIAAASSGIVAFIDDDAIPEPCWLDDLVAPLREPAVAVAGGLVMNHHGTIPEYDGIVADRLGRVRKLSRPAASDLRSFPESWEFAYAPGGNAAYRVDALREVGGFDERITYYLDETDCCLRLIDAGWIIATAPGAVVHHKSMPSAVRNERRAVIDWTQILRSRTYFARRHATAVMGRAAVSAAIDAMVEEYRRLVQLEADSGRLDDHELDRAVQSIATGREDGEALARLGPATALVPERPVAPFRPFGAVGRRADHRRVVAIGGSPMVVDSSVEHAPLEIRVVVPGPSDFTTVDLDGDLWVHRTSQKGEANELERILSSMPIDAVVTDRPSLAADLRACGTAVALVDDLNTWLDAPSLDDAGTTATNRGIHERVSPRG